MCRVDKPLGQTPVSAVKNSNVFLSENCEWNQGLDAKTTAAPNAKGITTVKDNSVNKKKASFTRWPTQDITCAPLCLCTVPPFRSAEAPTYWKLSMLMTSMIGDTTLVLSWEGRTDTK